MKKLLSFKGSTNALLKKEDAKKKLTSSAAQQNNQQKKKQTQPWRRVSLPIDEDNNNMSATTIDDYNPLTEEMNTTLDEKKFAIGYVNEIKSSDIVSQNTTTTTTTIATTNPLVMNEQQSMSQTATLLDSTQSIPAVTKSLKGILKQYFNISKAQFRELLKRNIQGVELQNEELELLLQIKEVIGSKNFRKQERIVKERILESNRQNEINALLQTSTISTGSSAVDMSLEQIRLVNSEPDYSYLASEDPNDKTITIKPKKRLQLASEVDSEPKKKVSYTLDSSDTSIRRQGVELLTTSYIPTPEAENYSFNNSNIVEENIEETDQNTSSTSDSIDNAITSQIINAIQTLSEEETQNDNQIIQKSNTNSRNPNDITTIESLEHELEHVLQQNEVLTEELDKQRSLVTELEQKPKQTFKQNDNKELSILQTKCKKLEAENTKLKSIGKLCKDVQEKKTTISIELHQLRDEVLDMIEGFESFFNEAKYELDKHIRKLKYNKTNGSNKSVITEQHEPIVKQQRSKVDRIQQSMFEENIQRTQFQDNYDTITHEKPKITTLDSYASDSDDETLSEAIERSLLKTEMYPTQQRIFVYSRLKPVDKFSKTSIQIIDNNTIEAVRNHEREVFSFDKVYTPMDTQNDLWEDVSYVPNFILDGNRNKACFITYGQTGSGKSNTLLGGTAKNNEFGILQRFVTELLKERDQRLDTHRYRFSLTAVELKGDQFRDLLSTKNTMFSKTSMRQYLTRLQVSDYTDFLKSIKIVEHSRNPTREFPTHNGNSLLFATRKPSPKTNMIITIYVEVMNLTMLDCEESQVSFVELAGSEKFERGYKGREAQAESKLVQKNFVALTEVLNSIQNETIIREQSMMRQSYPRYLKNFNQTTLMNPSTHHIPYRNSKLTYYLSDVLQPDSLVFFYVTLQPELEHYNENVRSLRYATSITTRSTLARESIQQQYTLSQPSLLMTNRNKLDTSNSIMLKHGYPFATNMSRNNKS
jgi:hypothetical protein